MGCFLRISVIIAAISSAYGQTAQLSGVVRDPSQAVVAGASMTVRNDETRVERVTLTNSEGVYDVPFLAPGAYTVTVQAPGFRPVERNGVKLDVAQSARLDFALELTTVGESVSVSAGAPMLQSESATVSTVIDRDLIDVLPLNGRSFQSLIALTPGVVMTKATFGEQGQFSVNGQRANANYFTIDGAGANIGVSTGLTLVQSSSGSLPGLGANGGTNTLVAVEAMQEFRVQTSSYAPEYGRTPGAQISIVTRSGTNQLHGSLFDFFRNDALDANDWFANANSLSKPELRQNDFGGVLGGPVIIPKFYDGRNWTFFFFSYEGLRLLQPQVESTDVPSLEVRQQSPANTQPYLNSFPLPNRPDTNYGFAPFVSSFSNADTLDATSLRVDHSIGTRVTLFGRYNYAPSNTTARLYALNNPTDTISGTTTLTLGATWLITPRLTNELRLNYSHTTGESFSTLDTFGGATPISPSLFFPPFADPKNSFGGFFLTGGVDSSWYLGKNVSNSERQYNMVDTFSFMLGSHQLKFGFDYRRIGTYNGPRAYDQFAYFTGATGATSGQSSEVVIDAQDPGSILFRNVSSFAQDAWKITRRLTLTYGLRWEINPAPVGGPNHPLYTFTDYQNPSQIQLAPVGTPLYKTTWTNFAPRVGVAYQLSQAPGRETTVRAGFGMFYDLGTGIIGQAVSSFPYYRTTAYYDGIFFPLPPAAAQPPPFSLNPPVGSIYGAVQGLKLPVTYEWNIAMEQSLGKNNALSLSWVGAAGRNLLRQDYFVDPNPNFTYVYLLTNTGFSDFESLQTQFQRRLAHGLQVLASWTWSHSLDNASNDSSSYLKAIIVNPLRDRGPSDFDIRHSVSAAFSYDVKYRWLRGWGLDGVYTFRTATPVDITYERDLGYGPFSFRPDLVPDVPLYIDDPNVAGGRRFDPAAFVLQSSYPGRQGTLGRNVMRGFPLDQMNFTVRREFPLIEKAKLQFRAEMFNALNHPNFADPIGLLQSPQFGQSIEMLGRDLGQGGVNAGLNPLYQIGGARSIQLALRVVF
jgi:hypothetical protein